MLTFWRVFFKPSQRVCFFNCVTFLVFRLVPNFSFLQIRQQTFSSSSDPLPYAFLLGPFSGSLHHMVVEFSISNGHFRRPVLSLFLNTFRFIRRSCVCAPDSEHFFRLADFDLFPLSVDQRPHFCAHVVSNFFFLRTKMFAECCVRVCEGTQLWPFCTLSVTHLVSLDNRPGTVVCIFLFLFHFRFSSPVSFENRLSLFNSRILSGHDFFVDLIWVLHSTFDHFRHFFTIDLINWLILFVGAKVEMKGNRSFFLNLVQISSTRLICSYFPLWTQLRRTSRNPAHFDQVSVLESPNPFLRFFLLLSASSVSFSACRETRV